MAVIEIDHEEDPIRKLIEILERSFEKDPDSLYLYRIPELLFYINFYLENRTSYLIYYQHLKELNDRNDGALKDCISEMDELLTIGGYSAVH